MLNHVIAFSLRNRLLVLAAAVAVAALGFYQLARTPKDVFPDLNRPTVTVLTEAPGLTPEDVEARVTRPIEAMLNGATGVQRVRSSSAVGLSVVWVEFDWGSDIYKDRQIVAEKLQLARERLPKDRDINPVLAPVSSIMGEIMLLGVRSTAAAKSAEEQAAKAMELRTFAEFTLRNRLLAVEGVAQVTVMGGTLQQYQIVTSPQRLAAQGVTLQQLVEAAEKANVLAGAGVVERGPRESILRVSAQSLTRKDLEETAVVWRKPRAVLVKDVADVRLGGPVKRGDGSAWVKEDGTAAGGPAVILTVQKQPHADTLTLDRRIDAALDEAEAELPADARIERHIFRQADFIQAGVDNVTEAVRDGILWVIVILFLFLWNLRTSLASLAAIPLSLCLTFLVFRLFGVTLNVMTLGGLAVAVGEVVDDSIVDVENIYRRLKENNRLPPSPPVPRGRGAGGEGAATPSPLTPLPRSGGEGYRKPVLQVIFLASSEVRNSIVYATLIVILVVLPLFAPGGLEGRLFAPLGAAYVVSLLASLVVSLTVTPVLCSFLLPRARFLQRRGDPWLLCGLKWLDERLLRFTLRHPAAVLTVAAVLAGLSLLALAGMGHDFLPPFNEGTFTVLVQAEPGTSLTESNRLGRQAEKLLLEIPEVAAVSRRTGRAEMDEHAEGVNVSEIDVRLFEHERPRPGAGWELLRHLPLAGRWGYETVGRPRAEVEADVRDRVSSIPGVRVNVGQPVAHRLDHVLSGVRAQVAVKVFGPDLRELRRLAADVQTRMSRVPGVVDLQTEPQAEISQLRLAVKRRQAARYGLAPGDVERLLVTAYKGRVVSEVIDGERVFDLVVWYDEASRNSPAVIGRTLLDTPSGRKVALAEVADVIDTTGPNALNREKVQRRIVVSCNVRGRDLGGVERDIRRELVPVEAELRRIGRGYRIEYGGQLEAQKEASGRLWLFGALAVAGVFLLLCKCLESWRAALQVLLVNLPLAALGATAALLIANRPDAAALEGMPWWRWPQVWVAATHLSLAHAVGFITLAGIASRNGILMISHYQHLMRHEGECFGPEMIVRGSLERLAPVLMTAATAGVGLLPLLMGAGQPGKELLHPLAVVVFGGLVASTLLDQLVTPALFYLFGRRTYSI